MKTNQGEALSYGKAAWEDVKVFAINVLVDVAKGGLLLLALYVFAFLLHLGKTLGMEEGYLNAFEHVHFWSSFAVYVVLALDFVWRFGKMTFGEMTSRGY